MRLWRVPPCIGYYPRVWAGSARHWAPPPSREGRNHLGWSPRGAKPLLHSHRAVALVLMTLTPVPLPIKGLLGWSL